MPRSNRPRRSGSGRGDDEVDLSARFSARRTPRPNAMASGPCSRWPPRRPRSPTPAPAAAPRSPPASRTSWRGAPTGSWARPTTSRPGDIGTRTAGRSSRGDGDQERGRASRAPRRHRTAHRRRADARRGAGSPLDRDPVATLVTLHPLPTAGGFMDSHIIRKAAARLPALADLAVLRFNFRGVSSPRGTSQGALGPRSRRAARPGRGDGSSSPSAACRTRGLLGWSFGTEIALKYGLRHPIVGAILLSPPLKRTSDEELAAWAGSGKRLVAVVPGVRRLPAPRGGRAALRCGAGGRGRRRRRRQAPLGGGAADPPRARPRSCSASTRRRCRCPR